MIEKTSTMTAKLIGEEGLLKELVLAFEEGDQWIIGRDPDTCQLLVEDPAASRKHASCRKTAEGIVIENLSTTNPVVVNDDPITEPKLLQHGDLVKIGDTLFRFYAEDEVHLFEERTETNIPEKDQAHFPTTSPETTQDVPPEDREDTIFGLEEESPNGGLAQVNFDLMETGRWLLKVVGGPNNGAEFSMHSGNSYVIGTDPNLSDIVFYDNSVSRQHARITVSQDDKITIEDLKSRNGTRVDGEIISSPRDLPFNTLVNIGTSSFVVYDREGEMQTIMSPLLPSIVKVLQKEERAHEALTEGSQADKAAEKPTVSEEPQQPVKPKTHALGGLIFTAILVGLFAVIGLAVQSLLVQAPVVMEQPIDTDKILNDTFVQFPGVKTSFNKSTGRLLLVGHVLTAGDKNELMNDLQGMKFIKDTDDSGLIIDEYVWNEANQILSKNPSWKGITVHASTPGHFVLSGYLQSRNQAQQSWDYLTRNFPVLDQLENKIVVEEDVVGHVNGVLRNQGLPTVTSQMASGELLLKGTIPSSKRENYEALVKEFEKIPGVRSVQSQVVEQAAAEAIVNISDRYHVSGFSRADSGKLTVIINGRIVQDGDILDGMKITQITESTVYLEKDGIKYRIDSSR